MHQLEDQDDLMGELADDLVALDTIILGLVQSGHVETEVARVLQQVGCHGM